MPVNGTYKFEKGENIKGFLEALGVGADKIKEITSITDRTVTLNYTGDKLEVDIKGKDTAHNSLTIGSPSPFTFGTGFEIEVTLTVSGNVAKGLLRKGDRKGEITIEYSDPGVLTETFNVEGNVAKKIYKKV